ncbi:MAG: DAK2 domain-containing protein [Candidatus Limnocylindrales bacterium]|jgi:DAK2 domain fusion protein YloV
MTRRSGDGAGLLAAFRAAVDNLAEHVDEVNALNVFPVPDGDTGSNMLATVRAALAEADAAAGQPADRVAAAISFGALMGARGNSGVIASQIFRGMADSLGGKERFDGTDLARSLTQGTATAYKAVVTPVEGTILTVIREASTAAVAAAEEGRDLESVLRAAVHGAAEAVEKTPALLPILREAGVVDAGGQGLLRLLEGALRYMSAHNPAPAEARKPVHGRALRIEIPADEGFGYETMFVLRARGDALDMAGLRTELERIGSSVLVAGDGRAVKVHVHNDRPDQVIALGLSMGSLTRVSVENLDAQSREVCERREAALTADGLVGSAEGEEGQAAGQGGHVRIEAHREVRHEAHREARPHVDLAMYGGEIDLPAHVPDGANGSGNGAEVQDTVPLAVVAVAAGDGLARIFDSYGVAAVVRGGQGNNPSTGELLDAVEKIVAEEILLLPNNPNVVLAARQASEMTTRRVRVVPTRNAAEGFAALLALDPSRDATANAEFMTLASRAIQTLQVTEAIRDAVVGGRRVRMGQTIVLDPDDGLLAVNNDRMKALLAALKALEPGFELVTIYYGDGADEAEAEGVARRIGEANPGVEVEVIHGGQPHYRYLVAAE